MQSLRSCCCCILPFQEPSDPVCRLLLICSAHSISDDRGYLSIRAGMWAGYELSVTRALGHKNLSEYGVLCEPTVNTMQLQPADACLVSWPGNMSWQPA